TNRTLETIKTGDECDDDEDEEFDGVAMGAKGLRTKHEVELPPIEKLNIIIPPSATLREIGTVFALVENMLVVESLPSSTIALDADTIVCTHDRKVIGKIFETFGPVIQPMYSIRYSSDVIDVSVGTGDIVFFVEEMAKYVFAAQLRALKGSDASNLYDEEVGEEELEFSDDEQEAEYRRSKKMRKSSEKRKQMG
ncbi:hypothetical protein HDU82_006300, partial [Entophlyctis luteolus]